MQPVRELGVTNSWALPRRVRSKLPRARHVQGFPPIAVAATRLWVKNSPNSGHRARLLSHTAPPGDWLEWERSHHRARPPGMSLSNQCGRWIHPSGSSVQIVFPAGRWSGCARHPNNVLPPRCDPGREWHNRRFAGRPHSTKTFVARTICRSTGSVGSLSQTRLAQTRLVRKSPHLKINSRGCAKSNPTSTFTVAARPLPLAATLPLVAMVGSWEAGRGLRHSRTDRDCRIPLPPDSYPPRHCLLV